jgi:hypothetical protein
LPAQQLAGCADILSSHFRDIRAFRLESPECVRYRQIVVSAIARSRRERDSARDSEISHARARLTSLARQYELLPPLTNGAVRFRVPPSGRAELSYVGLPLDMIEDILPASPAYRQVAQVLDPQPVVLKTRPLTPLHKGHIGTIRDIADFSCKPFKKRLLFRCRHSIVKMFYRMRLLLPLLAPAQ